MKIFSFLSKTALERIHAAIPLTATKSARLKKLRHVMWTVFITPVKTVSPKIK
jgi:hypothetical protein